MDCEIADNPSPTIMRGKQAPKRDIEGDAKYNDKAIAKFINYIMERGKKSVAESIVYDAFEIIKQKTKQDPRLPRTSTKGDTFLIALLKM